VFIVVLSFFPGAGFSVAANEKIPGIAFEKTAHQFGDLFQNENHSYAFRFKNTGIQPLKILSVEGT
jgi:hypothetical protein